MGRLEREDRKLLTVLDRDFARAADKAGDRLKCRPGCSECCYGPFPVTRLDVWRLRRGLSRLRVEDPGRAGAIAARAGRAIAVLGEGFPGDATTGKLDQEETRLDRFFERHSGMACPVLDPDTGRCDLYADRPVACRTYGPPIGFGTQLAPACPLCFRDAGPEEVERCRMRPDRERIEVKALAAAGAGVNELWDTLIVYAVAD